jgi:cytochrome c oxidase subunit 6a
MARALISSSLFSRILKSSSAKPPFVAAASKRAFASSTHEHDDAEETLKWRNITVAAYIACIALGIYTFAGEEHHEASERQEYSYLHIRNKQFPWGPNGLFEYPENHH